MDKSLDKLDWSLVQAFLAVAETGSLSGAVIAAIIYALFHTFITVYFGGTVATISGLILMVLVLIVRPTGLMGVRVSE